MSTEKETYPISKYVGRYPGGSWVFVKNFEGTYEQALEEISRLHKADLKTDGEKFNYCVWDDR